MTVYKNVQLSKGWLTALFWKAFKEHGIGAVKEKRGRIMGTLGDAGRQVFLGRR